MALSAQGALAGGDGLPSRLETQAAVTELLRMLRPGMSREELAAAHEAAAAHAQQQPPGGAAPAPAAPRPSSNQLSAAGPAQLQPTAQALAQRGGGAARAAAGALSPPPPPLPPSPLELPPCLSAEQEWDELREGGQAGGGGGGGPANAKAKGKAKGRARGGGDTARGARGRERSRYERFLDVEAFWRSTSEEQREELLRVPMASLLKGGWTRRGRWQLTGRVVRVA